MVKNILYIAGISLIAFAAGFLIQFYSSHSGGVVLVQNELYPHVNKAATANLNRHFIVNFQPLKQEFLKIRDKYKQQTYVYFAYLNNASWVGLNERDLFTAASTVKVPLAMSIYKSAESGKVNLTEKHTLNELELDMKFGDLYKAGTEKEFSVEELIQVMLEQSDNSATRALYDLLQELGISDPFSDVYTFMGWDFLPNFGEVQNYEKINLKTLANMFISLYNAGYVSVENSNKILSYLGNTPFNDKIVAGVPKSIEVSHKIGIATDNDTFSDCGIVYVPNRNYILCLGSSGTNEKTAAEFMSEISKATYEYVTTN